MSKLFITTVIAAGLLTSCSNEQKSTEVEAATSVKDTATTKETKAETVPVQIDSVAMMKAWQDFATPGDMHKWMAKFNGTWEADIVSYANPANPEKSKGLAVYSSALNGLYQEGKMTGKMMGMPFEGKSWMGYDNSKKEFVSTWIDNMGSGIVLMKGRYDEATKTLTLKGSQTDPTSGKDSDIREVMKITDDNTYTMEMYGSGIDGKEVKFMDALYRRKK